MTGIPADTQEGAEALSDDSCSIHLDVTELHDENYPRMLKMAPTTILPLHQRLSSATSHSQQHAMAWDLAPIVVSPCTNQGELYVKVQSTQWQTPQHIATVVIESKSSPPGAGDVASDDVSQISESPRVSLIVDGVGPVLDQGDGQESKVKFTETVKQNTHHQRLEADISSTKSCWCAPLIWKERYLIVAVNTGEIRVYGNLLGPSTNDPLGKAAQRHDRSFASPDSPVELIHVPLATLFLESDATIVQLLPLEDRDIIVALSVEGHAHVVQWFSDETLQIQNSWMTGGFGATCMTSVTHESQPILILIGYTSGIIDCWKLPDEKLAPSSTTKSRRPLRKRPICLWKGRVHGVCAVQSLATMPATSNPTAQDHYTSDRQDDDAAAATLAPGNAVEGASSDVDVKEKEAPSTRDDHPASAKTEAFNTSLLIIAVIQSTIGEDSPMVHAFDLDAILGHRRKESLTATLRIRDDVSLENESKATDILTLASFRILPDPAMGLLEVEPPSIKFGTEASPNSNLASTSKFHIPNVIIPKACRATSMPGSPVVAVTMWNGTVAQLSPGWGVSREQDQLLFPYPVVSVGSLMYQSTPHWVLGLRGGTCYLIPVADDKHDNVRTIRVIMYPHDIDADNSSIYVQELTAGNLQDKEGGRTVPVLLYVMPGGVVDIYSCGLVTTSDEIDVFPSENEQVLEALIKQGCLDMVLRILQERKDTICRDNDYDEILWKDAYDEVMVLLAANTTDDADADINQTSVGDGRVPNSMPFTSRKPRTLDDLRPMSSLRTLLLSLATRDD